MDRTTEIILLIVILLGLGIFYFHMFRSNMDFWRPILTNTWMGIVLFLSILAAILLFVWLYSLPN